MKFSEALNQTLEEFHLSGKLLAQEAGVREATLSEYRRSKREIHTDNLERLITALPPEAKQYLFVKLLIGELDKRGISVLLNAIAHHIKTESIEPLQHNEPPAFLSLR